MRLILLIEKPLGTYPLNVPTYAVEFTEIIEDAQTLLNSIESKI